MISFKSKDVENVFEGFDDLQRIKLLEIRELIFKVGEELNEAGIPIGEISESLKWGQPSYISKVGTPIRLSTFEDTKIAVFFHCQTRLITTFRTIFGNDLEFSGNRAIILNSEEDLPIDELILCIDMALIYHYKK